MPSPRGQHEKLNLLIGFGADVNEKNSCGYTALHLACIRGAGHPCCVKLLVAAGADVDLDAMRPRRGHAGPQARVWRSRS